jgi:hypothetical protein
MCANSVPHCSVIRGSDSIHRSRSSSLRCSGRRRRMCVTFLGPVPFATLRTSSRSPTKSQRLRTSHLHWGAYTLQEPVSPEPDATTLVALSVPTDAAHPTPLPQVVAPAVFSGDVSFWATPGREAPPALHQEAAMLCALLRISPGSRDIRRNNELAGRFARTRNTSSLEHDALRPALHIDVWMHQTPEAVSMQMSKRLANVWLH